MRARLTSGKCAWELDEGGPRADAHGTPVGGAAVTLDAAEELGHGGFQEVAWGGEPTVGQPFARHSEADPRAAVRLPDRFASGERGGWPLDGDGRGRG
jgi:hypothetical protein